MRKIGFVGFFDKTYLILCLSKILIKSQQRVLYIDGTSIQKTKYVVPSIIPTRSYITTYQDIDIAVGFENYEKVIQYIGVEEEASLEYDFIFVDVDDYEGFEDFDLYRFDLLYYITSFDAYSLNKEIEILRFLETPVRMEKLFFSKEMFKEEEEYFNYLALGVKVEWDDNKLYFPLENGDQAALIENQRLENIKLKNLSNIFRENVSFMMNEIDPNLGPRNIKNIMKDL